MSANTDAFSAIHSVIREPKRTSWTKYSGAFIVAHNRYIEEDPRSVTCILIDTCQFYFRRIAACDWLMQRFCCCCACMKRPLGMFSGTTRYSTTVVTDVSVTEDSERRKSGARLSLEPQRRVAPYDRDVGHTKESRSLLRSLPEEGAKCKEMESIAWWRVSGVIVYSLSQ
jgi:hypothetical protein